MVQVVGVVEGVASGGLGCTGVDKSMGSASIATRFHGDEAGHEQRGLLSIQSGVNANGNRIGGEGTLGRLTGAAEVRLAFWSRM